MISVFDKYTKQSEFWDSASGAPMCGERILNPFSCKTSEQLNGDYSLSIQCPVVEEDDSSRFVLPGNIIRPNSGQLYKIYEVGYETIKGVPTITANARHIWYYLNDKLIKDYTVDMFNGGYWAIKALFDNAEFGRDPANLTDYDFGFYSDLPNEDPGVTGKSSHFENKSIAYALLGSADSIISKWGGELHRDNFNFSINVRKEGARDNAFSIIHGWNCSDIKARINIDNMITQIETTDNMGGYYAKSYTGSGLPAYASHQIIAGYKMSYQEHSTIIDDTDRIFGERMKPEVSYKVQLVNLKDTTAEAGWSELEQVKVGDTGTVFSDVFGINTTQKVISVVRDEITERNEDVELGNFVRSSIHTDRWDKVLSGDSAAFRRLEAIESLIEYIDER